MTMVIIITEIRIMIKYRIDWFVRGLSRSAIVIYNENEIDKKIGVESMKQKTKGNG